MILMDTKIKEICERRKFTSFWEAFDYMKLANYDEIEALMISSQLFNGKIWDRVVNAGKQASNSLMYYSGGTTTTLTGNWTVDLDPGVSDDLLIEIVLMTNKGLESCLPIYKAYAETRKYAPNDFLESHIKLITINLTTELGISLFNDGFKRL